MKDICVVLVILSETILGAYYIRDIRRKKAFPMVSTWTIFLVGCFLSLVTYMIAEDKDIRTGIFNTVDLFYVCVVLVAVILWGTRNCQSEKDKEEERVRKIFEKWYWRGAVAIVAYGLVSGDAWKSNWLAQGLMLFAYFPTWHKMIAQKRNTESFMGWIPASAIFAVYPAVHNGNALSLLYACRAFVLCIITMSIMVYYELKARRR